jgi:hypothetical protein
MARLWDSIFQLCHRAANVIGSGLDVVVCRCADVSVPQNSLNHHIRDPQAVQVTSKPAPGSVPTVPLGNGIIAFVLVARAPMFWLHLPANFAAIQRRKKDPVDVTPKSERFPESISEYRTALPIPASQSMYFEPFRQLPNRGNGRRAFASFRFGDSAIPNWSGYGGAYVLPNFTTFSRNVLKGWEISASLYNAFNKNYGDPGRNGLAEGVLIQNGRNFRIKIGYQF